MQALQDELERSKQQLCDLESQRAALESDHQGLGKMAEDLAAEKAALDSKIAELKV